MIEKFLAVVFLLKCLNYLDAIDDGYREQSHPEGDYYVVGVVEFRPELLNMDIATRTGIHLQAYKELMRSEEAKLTDIVVFPELTLNTLMDPIPVPDPQDAIIPCVQDSPDLLAQLSCLAIETGKYIVINLSESFDCDSLPPEDLRPCDPAAYHRYNTNVVFDRNGTLVARYRKFNIFREPGTSVTFRPEIVTFDTDFGVTFGVFTCFDLLFAEPALELVKHGVKDFVFPAMWVSEPPFLTAVQIFESWAYGNHVNLIAAGTNYDPAGSTGTGVFNGRNGAVFGFITGEPTRKLFPVRVPKIHGSLAPNTVLSDNSEIVSGRPEGNFLENIVMGQDFLDRFSTVVIKPEQVHQDFNRTLCNGDFCCDFRVSFSTDFHRNISHRYRLAVFDGVRTFQGYADAHVTICGIITCRNESLASCGLPMYENSHFFEFDQISISGDFIANGTLAMPSSLDDKFHSLDADRYLFHSTVDYPSDRQHVQLTLAGTTDDLQTFAIYAFNHEGFEFFNPKLPPQEITTTTERGTTAEDDGDGASAMRRASGLKLIITIYNQVYNT
ncbi:vanin-like protein 1 [Ochlerotatus camptorhynchus]|uniref:vanin-like protein 1 n=1 Tax=Ochlerotatus camptorhynchus TaxID=644619 RepID=UPI0031DADA9B